MYMTRYLFVTLCFVSFLSFSQNSIVVSGTVTSFQNDERLVGVRLTFPDLLLGVLTDSEGFFSIAVPIGTHKMQAFSVEMQPFERTFTVYRDTFIVLQLHPLSKKLNELEVVAKRLENVESVHMGQLSLEIDEIRKLPAFLGEVDPIRAIQLLPGVSSVAEAGQGFYVRGGGPDQNLVLIDDAVIYNSSHLFGFFSVFNPDALKNVNLIKGGMPAQYGGRLSSVLEVNTSDGNDKHLQLSGGIGLISSRLTLQAPIKKERGSFMIAARRTYIDLLMKLAIPKSSDLYGSSYYFYDLNFKGTYRLSENDQLFLSGYFGKDEFLFQDSEDDFLVRMPWNNGTTSIKWQHVFTRKLLLHVVGMYSHYNFSFGSEQEEIALKLSSNINDIGTKTELTFLPNNRHSIKFGTQYTYHIFTPTSVSANQDSVNFNTGLGQRLFSHETGTFLSDDWDISEKMRVSLGMRYTTFSHVGTFTRLLQGNIAQADTAIHYKKGETIAFYHDWEPRLAFRYMFSNLSSLKAGFAYNSQYIHLASISSVSLPTDIWYPSTELALPERGWQAAVGYFRNFFNDIAESSVEFYYKRMNNLLEFKEGALPTDNINDNTDNLLTLGRGWSYGMEVFVKKKRGKFTGWIGYTWSKTERLFTELNQGMKFPAKYDRRHDLSVVGNYAIGKRLLIGATFIYATGNTLTLPNSWYVHQNNLLFHYGDRNSSRIAPYHRVDVSITWYGQTSKHYTDPATNQIIEKKKRVHSNWVLSVYNLYNRANPYFMYLSRRGSVAGNNVRITTKQVSLFPILPSFTWNFEFN